MSQEKPQLKTARLDTHFNRIREQQAKMQQVQMQQQHLKPPQLSIPEHPSQHQHPQMLSPLAKKLHQQILSPEHPEQPPSQHQHPQMLSPQHHMLSPMAKKLHQQILSP